jgi:hypothetical protein
MPGFGFTDAEQSSEDFFDKTSELFSSLTGGSSTRSGGGGGLDKKTYCFLLGTETSARVVRGRFRMLELKPGR